MNWLQALLLGIVQGLTEFLPVSSSGHLMIVRDLLGVDGDGFMDFTVTVHLATVLSTVIVFWKPICKLLAGLFKFRYNDETDYVFKIVVSMVPIAVVGLLFKDKVEALFSDNLFTVAVCLIVTAILLYLSDISGRRKKAAPEEGSVARNGISYWQAVTRQTGLSPPPGRGCGSGSVPFRHHHRHRASVRSQARGHGAVLVPHGARADHRRTVP